MGNQALLVLAVVIGVGLTACATSEPEASLIRVTGANPAEVGQVWDRLYVPVRVVEDPSLPPSWHQHVASAVDRVNAVVPGLVALDPAAGAEVAAYHEFWGHPPKGVVFVHGDGGNTRWYASTTNFRRYGWLFAAATELPDGAADTFMGPQMALHELLHALGVAHERDPHSVMAPYSTVWSTEFRPATKALLQRTYGRNVATKEK